MKFNKLLIILSAITSVFVCNITSPVIAETTSIREVTNAHDYSVQWTNDDFGNYYSSIDFSSYSTLLDQLQDLNAKKRSRTVGYDNMWDYFDQTDYYPSNTSKYVAFYQGTAANKSEMNKEHVWPKSHGSGGRTDADIHMVRPTFSNDNSSRGNSFYVEGMNHTSNGWDPKAAGMNEQYRGQAARIIFYCVVADSKLSLVDTNYSATSNDNPDYKMGKLSDLLKWNLEYAVDITELNRNNGAEDIQGNRNPFIDNPYLACAIWGNYNDATRAICEEYDVIVDPYTGNITLPDYPSSGGNGSSDGSGSGTTTPINYGTASAPLTVSQVADICKNFSSNDYSQEKGYVTGVVKTAPTLNQHGSYEFYLDAGNISFQVYSAKLSTNVAVPQIGDTVVVNGYFKKYNDIYEVAYIGALNDSPYIISVNSSSTPSVPDTPTPDNPNNGGNEGGNTGTVTTSISFDFNSSNIASTSYTKGKTVTINGNDYYFSDIYVGESNGSPVVRLGNNNQSNTIQEIGLSGYGSYLKPMFDLENCLSIELEIKATYTGTEGYKILFQEKDSNTYTSVKEGSLSGATTLSASLATPKTGRFIIVITGSKARADLGSFTISTAEVKVESNRGIEDIVLNPSVSSNDSKSSLKFSASMNNTHVTGASKYGILVFSSNQLGNKTVKDLYVNGNLSSFKSSISKYSIIDYDFTNNNLNEETTLTAIVNNVKGHEDFSFTAVVYVEINGVVYFSQQVTTSYNQAI